MLVNDDNDRFVRRFHHSRDQEEQNFENCSHVDSFQKRVFAHLKVVCEKLHYCETRRQSYSRSG
jgi:hypothetical protein